MPKRNPLSPGNGVSHGWEVGLRCALLTAGEVGLRCASHNLHTGKLGYAALHTTYILHTYWEVGLRCASPNLHWEVGLRCASHQPTLGSWVSLRFTHGWGSWVSLRFTPTYTGKLGFAALHTNLHWEVGLRCASPNLHTTYIQHT